MKYVMVLWLVLVSVGCNDSSDARHVYINNDKENNPYLGRFKQYGTGTDLKVVVDTKTGCEYLANYSGAAQPFGNCGREK